MGEQEAGEGGGVWEEIQGYSHGSMSHGRATCSWVTYSNVCVSLHSHLECSGDPVDPGP